MPANDNVFFLSFIVAVWAWGANLHYLHLINIDVPALIRYPGRSSPHHPSHHLSTYRFATVLSAIYGFSLLVFWAFTHRDPARVLAWDWLPLTYLGVLLALFLVPLGNLSSSGRGRLRSTLRRIAVGGIAETKDGKFGDILLADVLTSYAKVLADLYVALCMFLRPDERGDGSTGATARPDRGCGGSVIVPLVLAIPSLIRLRQCLIEYGRVRRGPMNGSTGWGGQHLANALKYATAFPVVIFGALQRSPEHGAGYFRAWVVACLVNSFYSFYWDVAKDWDLTLFDGAAHRTSPSHPYGLRRRLHVGPPTLYYAVIAQDLALRCTWALKLSARMAPYADLEGTLFTVQFLEVFRRWVWIFFRVETEWIRNTGPAGPGGGPSAGLLSDIEDDDILLGDFAVGGGLGKYEDED